MEYLIATLIIFILGCVIHLEREVSSVKTIVKRLDNNSKVDSKKSKGRKKLKGE